MGEAALEFREMTTDDLDRITEIEEKSFALPWSRNLFQEEADNENAHYIVGLLEKKIVAYAGAWVSVEYGEAEVMSVAVEPEYRGRGIGTRLFARLIEEVKRFGATAITLEVRPSNEAAIKLYEKFGLRSVGRRPHYYIDNDEDALIMWNTKI